MVWETRNGRKFFYISQRDGDKVRKIYAGCGDAGRAAELALQCRREAKNRPREWLRNADRKFAELDAVDAEVAVGLAAVLYAEYGIRMDARAGRRVLRKKDKSIMEETVRDTQLSPDNRETWQRLREQASRGDREAAKALLPFLDEHPQVRDRLGDLSRHALNQWLELIAGRDEVAKRAMHAKVLQLIDSVRRDAGDPLEVLLAQRVGLQWLQAHYVDVQLGLAVSRTHEEQEFLAKRQQTTQQAYKAAIAALQDYQTRADKPPRTAEAIAPLSVAEPPVPVND